MVNGSVCGFLVLGVGTKDGWTNSTQTVSVCRGKEKGNTPREVDFSFPGIKSKYDEIS